MTSLQSLRLYELSFEFIKDKTKAKEFVSKIEQAIDEKFIEKEKGIASKDDINRIEVKIAEVKTDMIKWYVALFVTLALMIIGLYIK